MSGFVEMECLCDVVYLLELGYLRKVREFGDGGGVGVLRDWMNLEGKMYCRDWMILKGKM